MQTVKVIEWIDIHAPRAEVFALIVDIEKRMQLSPLWGVAKIENPSHDYPNEGSSYDVEIHEQAGSCFETIVTAFEPLRKLAYKSLIENSARVTWSLQEIKQGTRLSYMEEFLCAESDSAELQASVKKIVGQWLANIRRYAELRGTRTKRLAKWLVDRFYIKLLPAQRQTVATILYMHAIGAITFIMAALAVGIASLFL